MESTNEASGATTLLPVYAILGEQSFLREQAVDRLKKRLIDEGEFEFNFDQYDAATTEPETILAAADALPFMSPYRLIIVTNIHQAKKPLLDALGAYAQKPYDTTVMAVVGEKLVKSLKLYQAIKKIGGIVERSNPRKNELPAITRSLFTAQGKQASVALCGALVESVGTDLEALNTAITKIATYMGDRRDVTRDDIDAVVEVSVEVKIWELTDAIVAGRGAEALALFETMLAQESTLFSIHPAIVKTIRDLIVARTIIEESNSPTEVASALGVPDWKAKRVYEGARRYRAEELRQAMDRLAHVEHVMKTSSDGVASYQRFIVDLTTHQL